MRCRAASLTHERLLACTFAAALGHGFADELQHMLHDAAWSATLSRCAATPGPVAFSALLASQHFWPVTASVAAGWKPPAELRPLLERFDSFRRESLMLRNPLPVDAPAVRRVMLAVVFVQLPQASLATHYCWGCAARPDASSIPCACGTSSTIPIAMGSVCVCFQLPIPFLPAFIPTSHPALPADAIRSRSSRLC
jgi:hypothetical protein